jgi:site-specific DNA recombinase
MSKQVISPNGHKRAVIYARVSGDDRKKEKRNLAGQLEMGRKYAQERGYTIVAELPEDDRGASGAEIDLPQLSKALDMARAGEYDVFVVREIDRLSRNLAKQLIVEEELKRAGVVIEYVIGEYADTPEGGLMKNVKASVAEYERLKIAERVRRGKRLKAQGGKLVPPAWSVYGYTKQDSRLVVNEAEAHIVRLIFQWYTEGDGGAPLSLREIALKLNEMSVPIPKPGYALKRYAISQSLWQRVTARRIIENEVYIGRYFYGKTKKMSGKAVANPRDGWIPIDIPDLAIVDPATFQAAQERRERNKQLARRNGKHDYLLAGHFRCASCGRIVGGVTLNRAGGRVVQIYRCNRNSGIPYCPDKCKQVSVHIADTLVWEWILSLFDTSNDDCTENIMRKVNEMNARREAAIVPKRKRLEVVGDLIAKSQRKIGGLAATIAEMEGEQVTEETGAAIDALKAQLKTASGEAAKLTREQSTLTTQLAKMPQPEPYMQTILDVARLLRDLKDPSYESKRRWLDRLNVQIYFRHDPDTGRWLDCSCEVGAKAIPLDLASEELSITRFPT